MPEERNHADGRWSEPLEVKHKLHTFEVNGEHEWIMFRIGTGNLSYWIYVWDALGKLRLHYYIVKFAKTAVIHRQSQSSSYGCVPGKIPTGKWKIEIMTAHEDEHYDVEWVCGSGELPADAEVPLVDRYSWATLPDNDEVFALDYDLKYRKQEQANWYRGDLHLHTTLSDGRITPEERMVEAGKNKLEFMMIADHNLLPTSWPKGETLIIPGTELSSQIGDCNLIGLTKWVDFSLLLTEEGLYSEAGLLHLIREARQSGALVSLNHPMIKRLYWRYTSIPLNEIDALEIWNFIRFPVEPESVEYMLTLWSVMWNDGYCIPGIGGTDSHREPFPRSAIDPPFPDWDLLVYIYASSLSTSALLEGIQQRHVYVTRGPYIAGSVQIGEHRAQIGDDVTHYLQATTAGQVAYTMELTNTANNSTIHWIENGQEVLVEPIEGDGTYRCSFSWTGEQYVWARPEIRAEDGKLLAFANPIYCGSKSPQLKTWQDVMDQAGLQPPS